MLDLVVAKMVMTSRDVGMSYMYVKDMHLGGTRG